MKVSMRRIAAGAGSVGLLGAGLLAVATPAEAAGLCGANYSTVTSVDIRDNETGRYKVGQVNVQYNSGNGYWCAVTQVVGTSTSPKVGLRVPGGTYIRASDNDESAGPVYRFRSAANPTCAFVEGSVLAPAGRSGGFTERKVCR